MKPNYTTPNSKTFSRLMEAKRKAEREADEFEIKMTERLDKIVSADRPDLTFGWIKWDSSCDEFMYIEAFKRGHSDDDNEYLRYPTKWLDDDFDLQKFVEDKKAEHEAAREAWERNEYKRLQNKFEFSKEREEYDRLKAKYENEERK